VFEDSGGADYNKRACELSATLPSAG
jgi:hypothetical protein